MCQTYPVCQQVTYMMSIKIFCYSSIVVTNISQWAPSQNVSAGTLMETSRLPYTLTQEPVCDTVCLTELLTMKGGLP